MACGFFASTSDVDARDSKRMVRIGWLALGTRPRGPLAMDDFRVGLADLGWVEGRDFVLEPRWADDQRDRLPGLAVELIGLGVDLIVTQGTSAALAARWATGVIPIVMVTANNPLPAGLAQSFARPGGNVTGVVTPGPGFLAKMIELLQQVAPGISRLAVLEFAGAARWREIESAAPALGITIVVAHAAAVDEVPAALARASRERADGLFVAGDAVIDRQRALIVKWTLDNGIPSIAEDSGFVPAGGLMSYWTDWAELRRRAAGFADKILRGAYPGDLPIEQPASFKLVINRKTANALGLKIPRALLMRADVLID